MIVGIGVDICQIERIADSYRRYGQRFCQRILSAGELADFAAAAEGLQVRFLARRFAAKEAALKALGTGARAGIGLQQAVVEHDALGKPLLVYTGAANERARFLGVAASLISISDERDYAVAMVVLQSSV